MTHLLSEHEDTYFSVVSRRLRSAESSSDSSRETLRWRPSPTVLVVSPSSKFNLASAILFSAASSSSSLRESWFFSDVISCSFWVSSFCRRLVSASDSSARAEALSTSTRRAASFYFFFVKMERKRCEHGVSMHGVVYETRPGFLSLFLCFCPPRSID